MPTRCFPIGLGLALLGVAGVVGPSLVLNITGGERQKFALTALPADAPDQGLVYDGLQPANADSLCAGAYAMDDQTCTHGPDAAPAGLKVPRRRGPGGRQDRRRRSPRPWRARSVPPDAEVARDEGGSALTADAPALIPDAAPGEADFIMGAHDVACESDGRTGKRVQVLYLHEFGTPSRYTDFLGSIRTWAGRRRPDLRRERGRDRRLAARPIRDHPAVPGRRGRGAAAGRTRWTRSPTPSRRCRSSATTVPTAST